MKFAPLIVNVTLPLAGPMGGQMLLTMGMLVDVLIVA